MVYFLTAFRKTVRKINGLPTMGRRGLQLRSEHLRTHPSIPSQEGRFSSLFWGLLVVGELRFNDADARPDPKGCPRAILS